MANPPRRAPSPPRLARTAAHAPAGVVRRATLRDLRFLQHLGRKNCDAVGFLPTQALEHYTDAGGVCIVTENGDPAGMLVVKDHLSTSPAIRPVLQAAVCYDARRRHLGLQLVRQVEQDARTAGRRVLQLKCREELPANEFWTAAGFELIGHQDAGERRGGRVCVWAKLLSPLTASDLILKKVERHRGPGGFYSSRPLVIHPVHSTE
jgi:N-acetylglutamate synthase-like GNAT family acetyltransferase